MLRQAERLAHQAAQAIALHRVSRGFHRNGQAHARMRETIGFDAQAKEPVVDAPTGSIDRVELELAAQAQLSAKTKAA